ncbi:MAG: hypothetical protein QHJ73_17465, partial [Armatimonadota bacterium]|nr:hypothetical protein [Armatimonadota bacterium]
MRRRVVVAGLLLIPLNAWWLAQVEYVRYSDTPTIPSLYFHCVSLLLLLAGLNAAVRAWRPVGALYPAEMLLLYAMLVIASNLAGHDQLQILFTTLAWPLYRATPENRWGETVLPNLPQWLLPEAWALPPLFSGHASLYAEGHWRAWLLPVGVWLCVVCTLAFTMFCLMSLLRRQWDHERLTYPLAEVPLAIVQREGSLFARPPFWAAFALAAGLQLLSLAATFFPTVPVTNLGVRYYPLFQTWPWRAFGTVPVCFYPFALGVSFLLPLEVLFSCWLFSLVGRLELVAGAAAGYTNANDFPFVHQQVAGAFVGFGLCVLWGARRHLCAAWRRARGAPVPEDAQEPLSYRAALLGATGGTLVLFAGGVLLGVRPWVAALYLAGLFLIVLTFARIRAEAGLPSFGLERYGPDQVLAQYAGLSGREVGVASLLFFLTRTHRQLPMQNYADAMRLADRSGTDQ